MKPPIDAICPIGVVHGRFQPLHLSHMDYILASLKQCDHLLVGVTNPDPEKTSENIVDLKRSEVSSNPLTFWERLMIIESSLIEG
jgi:nicotinamide-nucleotide adenylyltransferase